MHALYVFTNILCFLPVCCWFHLVSDGSISSQFVLCFSFMVPGGFNSFQLIPGGSSYFQMVLALSSFFLVLKCTMASCNNKFISNSLPIKPSMPVSSPKHFINAPIKSINPLDCKSSILNYKFTIPGTLVTFKVASAFSSTFITFLTLTLSRYSIFF